MQVARSTAAGADCEFASQMRLRTRRESSNLLKPDMYPLDLPLAADGICYSVEAVTNDTVNPFDSR